METTMSSDVKPSKSDVISLEKLKDAIDETAQDASDNIIYDINTGSMFYDSDGNGAGAAPVLFARVTAGLALTNLSEREPYSIRQIGSLSTSLDGPFLRTVIEALVRGLSGRIVSLPGPETAPASIARRARRGRQDAGERACCRT